MARARAVKPTLVIDDRTAITIAEICRRLDGLPLAIELAAARITILSPDTLLARLGNRLQVLGGERRGVPDRLRTMRHAIAWSYDLLSPDEQALFRRLSVLAGGFSLDTVEAMSRGLNDGRGAIDVLSALVDHSLVQGIPAPSGENRFLILETLRAYGQEQLALLGEEPEAQLANATCFRDLAETAEPHLTGRGQEVWLNRLDAEWENIRATVDWALDSGHAEIVLRIFGAIWRFCSVRGHTTESRAFLDQALAATTDDQTTRRTRALVGAGYLAEDQRDLDIAQAYFMQARDLALRIGSETDQVRSLIGMGFVAHDRGDYATAMTFHTQVADLARSINDRRSLASAFSSMGAVSYFQGDLDEAVRYWEEARQIVMALGDQMAEATVSGNLGSVAMAQGDFERAVRLQRRALELHRQLDNKPDIAFCLINLAEQLRHLGDYAGANELLAEGIPLLRELGYKGTEGMGLNIHASLALAEGDDVRSASLVLESTRLFAEVGDQLSIAENADLLAEICAARGDHVTAVELMASSATIRTDLGSDPTPLKLQQLKAIDDRIRQVVNEMDYARHWQAGAGLDLDALVRRITIVAREIVGVQQPPPRFPEPATPGDHAQSHQP